MKQETIEEAAEKYLQECRLLNNIHLSNPIHAERCKNNFIAGGNYQAEKMYSEEDMKKAFQNGLNRSFDSDFDRWIEQFKNK